MLTVTLKSIFVRDLKKLRQEIDTYKTEKNIWRIDKGITNSAGNLCLHIIGNLNWFIGAQLGNTGYIRHRDLEFSSTNVSKDDLLMEIDKTSSMLENTLDKITASQLELDYPILVFQQKSTTQYFLVHLTTHLAYHLGQINYHRRLLDE
ncbi:MAG: DinB family protein [Flavobacteriaceae bacterium]|nr:DinB family protein [Flavobacteriaceae bacterium]